MKTAWVRARQPRGGGMKGEAAQAQAWGTRGNRARTRHLGVVPRRCLPRLRRLQVHRRRRGRLGSRLAGNAVGMTAAVLVQPMKPGVYEHAPVSGGGFSSFVLPEGGRLVEIPLADTLPCSGRGNTPRRGEEHPDKGRFRQGLLGGLEGL